MSFAALRSFALLAVTAACGALGATYTNPVISSISHNHNIFEKDGTYYLTVEPNYLVNSTDLVHWNGPVNIFSETNRPSFASGWNKAQFAVVNGTLRLYFGYWNGSKVCLGVATPTDLRKLCERVWQLGIWMSHRFQAPVCGSGRGKWCVLYVLRTERDRY